MIKLGGTLVKIAVLVIRAIFGGSVVWLTYYVMPCLTESLEHSGYSGPQI